ncbi:hypothetical protein JKP88DRAFT_303728 [Tribonema minus]|uniref:LRRK2 ARM repeat domain-containing protein n=1 Tax=Tribonema minus TaxID=303371 RepID=A0A836CJT7_9STRA|nr:hypothetical protein JKP88DRAFT_303728 [Tribonema minus]
MALMAAGSLTAGATRVQLEADLIASGACEAVVQLLNAHASSRQVQIQGLAALGVLVSSDEARVRLITADAGATAIRAMREFPAESMIQRTATSTILHLALGSDAYAAQLVDMGSFALVTAALNTCFDRPDPKFTALQAICILVASMQASRVDLASACAATVAAMNAHPDNEDVNEAGLLALERIAHVTSCTVLHNCGVQATVVNAMQQLPYNESIQDSGEHILQQLPRRSQRAE